MNENNHKCTRCGYSTNHLVTFKRHLSMKNICKNLWSNDNLNDLCIKYKIYEKINDELINQKKPQKTQKITLQINECKYCGKSYSKKCHLLRHLKTCKEKIKDDEDKKNLLNLVEILNKQLEEQRDCMAGRW